ncbi:hypothetical protein M405DRAFT_540322 [Rhizopogon salebrosus TDB-379]|nr:hypothetical protein M405DRAFT_540322 [Rhizopogon salebrosus TDB-379]
MASVRAFKAVQTLTYSSYMHAVLSAPHTLCGSTPTFILRIIPRSYRRIMSVIQTVGRAFTRRRSEKMNTVCEDAYSGPYRRVVSGGILAQRQLANVRRVWYSHVAHLYYSVSAVSIQVLYARRLEGHTPHFVKLTIFRTAAQTNVAFLKPKPYNSHPTPVSRYQGGSCSSS